MSSTSPPAPATRRSPPRQRGASVTASDLTPELLEAGRHRAEGAGVELDWVEADAEHLPFEDGAFDVVISSIGVMFAPHHHAAADELVRVCRPGGTIGLLSWTPEGMIGGAVPHDGSVRAAAAARRPAPAAVGERRAPRRAVRRARRLRDGGARRARRDGLHAPARLRRALQGALRPDDRGAQERARATAAAGELDAALDRFCDEWNRGTEDRARFEMEYLLTVGTRVAD